MKRTAIFKTFALLLLASAITLGTTVEAKNPNPTPCKFSNKVRSTNLTQAEWDQVNAIYRKFVKGYVIEKQKYDKSNPINYDRIPSKGQERRNFFEARMREINRQYKNRIMTEDIMGEDPNFYRIIENGPDGWNYTEKDKEVWRNGLWNNFSAIGYYKEEIMGLADTDENSLASFIPLIKELSVGSSREAARIKKMTLGFVEDERSYLHKQIKRLDGLVCKGDWNTSWYQDIYDESGKGYSQTIDDLKHNALVIEQERVKTQDSSSRPSCPLIWSDRYRAYDACTRMVKSSELRHSDPFGTRTCGGAPLFDMYKPCR